MNLPDLSASTVVPPVVASAALQPQPTMESVAASVAIPNILNKGLCTLTLLNVHNRIFFTEKQKHDALGRFMKKTDKQGKVITAAQKQKNIVSSAVSKLKKSIKQKMALIQKLE